MEEFGQRWFAEVATRTRKLSQPVQRELRRDIYPTIGTKPIRRITA